MGRPSRVIVLAEDRRHQGFIRRYLQRLGFSNHDIRSEDLPSARGCGEQWVRERYAGGAVRAFRARAAKADTALVVAIDADKGDGHRRIRQLQQALSGAGLDSRADHERIAHFVPRRSIETWILCLNGTRVDEETDYGQERDIDQRIPTAALVFFTWSRPNATIPERCVPSLQAAIPEIRRIE